MIATIKRMTDIMGGKTMNTPMLEVAVTKADGSDKAYKIPKFKKTLVMDFMKYGPGDVVDIEFTEENGFMNITGVAKSDGVVAPSTIGGYKGGDSFAAKTNGKNKGVALSYAMRYVLPQITTEVSLRKMGAEAYVDSATAIASRIVAWLEGKETDAGGGSTDSAESADDSGASIPTPDIS
jgi:hypothetical protein